MSQKQASDLTELEWLGIFRSMTKKEFRIYGNLIHNRNRATGELGTYLSSMEKKYSPKLHPDKAKKPSSKRKRKTL